MDTLTLTVVESPAEMQSFLEFPWGIYQGDPHWIPPLQKELKRLLDPSVHPFWQFSRRRLLLARRGRKIVGRIAGIIDHNYNRFHDERMAGWGFFECDQDPEAAAALFDAVADWSRQQGMTFLRGPLNPSTNYEVGLLIQGFEHPPVFMLTYNPPYYPQLVESAGFCKEKDLLSFRLDRSWQPPQWIQDTARRIKEKSNITVRPGNLKDFQGELNLIKEIYHDAWFDNWGFVPMSDAEAVEMGRHLVRLVDSELIFIMHDGTKAVGAGIVVPDINPILKRLNGSFGGLGFLKALWYRRFLTGFRGLIFGIRKEYQNLGLPLVAFDYLYNTLYSLKKFRRYYYIELGWNLEDNDQINQWYLDGGVKPTKRYRVYRREL
ncbi:MAG: hypothetical protein WCD80_09120 [Desulfobaccales bacterium]